MTYTINQSMLGSDPIDTSYTVTTTNNTSGSNLWWGLNGTSASPHHGQVFTTNGTNTQWATITSDPSLKGATLHVKGDADFEGDVTLKGKSLSEMFEKIEERLAILHPNPELEDKWDELKELGKRYKELEQEIIEKERVWAILKK
jgi:hypothetical protein